VVLNEQPQVVLVVGYVNSTAAYALVAKKTWCRGDQHAKDFIPKLAHVEAGLRRLDRTMPKEINRIVTDSVTISSPLRNTVIKIYFTKGFRRRASFSSETS
jgi:UDP-N-acetylglucosamine 2-epimerase (non-hydrolysing)